MLNFLKLTTANYSKSIFLGLLSTVVLSLLVVLLSIYIIYDTSIQDTKSKLLDIVLSEKNTIITLHKITGNKDSTVKLYMSIKKSKHSFGLSGELLLAEAKLNKVRLMPISIFPKYIEFDAMSEKYKKLPIYYSMLDSTGSIETYDYKGNNVLSAFSYIDDLKMGIVAKVDYDEFFAPYRIAYILILSITLIALILIGFLFFISFRPFVKLITQSENNFKSIFESSGDAIVVFDSDSNIIKYNTKFADLTGYDEKSLKIIKLTDIDNGNNLKSVLKSLSSISGVGNNFYCTTEIIGKNNHIISVECNITTTMIDDANYYLSTIRDISSIREKERSLKETTKYLENLLKYASGPIITWNKEYVITGANSAFHRLINSEYGTLEGQKVEIIFPINKVCEYTEFIKLASSGQRLESIDIDIVSSDGIIKNCLWSSANVTDDEGNIKSTIAQCIDISIRKNALKSLSESETKYRNLVEAISDFIWETDSDRKYTYLSPQVEKLFGYKPEELIGKTPFEFMEDLVIDEQLSQSDKIVSEKVPFYNLISTFISKDGEPVYVETSGQPIYDDKNNFIGYRGISHNATKRIKSLEQLKKSEERFRLMFETHLSVMMLIDPNTGNILDVNQTAVDFYGWSREELQNMNIADINAMTTAEIYEEMQKALSKNQIHFEFKHRLADKSMRDVEVYSSKINLDGKDYLFSIIHDVTNRRNAEKQIIDTNNRLQKLINIYNYNFTTIQDFLDYSLDQAIALTESKIGYIYFYNEEEQMFILNSWSKDVMKECSIVNPQTCYELDKTGVWGEAVRQKKEIIMNDFDEHNPLKKGYPEGHVHLKKYMTLPIIDNDKIVAVVGVANKESDYSERDVYELRLLMNSVWATVKRRESDDRNILLIEAIENSPAGIMITDSEGKIDYVNSKLCEISGFSQNELIGKKTNILSSGFHSKEFYVELWQTIIQGETWKGEFCNRRKNGDSYWENTIISPIKNKIGEITNFVAVKDDVTENRIMLEKIIKAKQLAEQSEQLKTNFLANMSHEIRTPMNGIMGFTNLLMDSEDLDEVHELAKIAHSSSKRLLSTLNMLVDLSQLKSGISQQIQEEVDIHYIISEQMDFHREFAYSKSLEFDMNIEFSNIEVKSSRIALESIISNLLNNAIKFTDKGFVKINAKLILKNKTYYLIINVTDSGIGIDEKHFDLIFEEFRQVFEGLNRSYEGSGIGLTIVKEYLRTLNGTIEVESKLGKGSSFTVTIPVEAITDNLSKEDMLSDISEYHKPTPVKHNIILVSDNPYDIKVIERSLSGFVNLINLSNPLLLKEENAYICRMLLIDLNNLIDNSYSETIMYVRKIKSLSKIPVLAIANTIDSNLLNNLRNSGFEDVIVKPYDSEVLIGKMLKFELLSDSFDNV